MVELLLCGGADPDQSRQGNGATALYVAASGGHVKVVQLLLAHSADPNKARAKDGATALYLAASKGLYSVARLLLGCNADPNKPRTDAGAIGATPLHVAAQAGHLAVAQLLAVFGANISALVHYNGKSRPAQQYARKAGHGQLAHWLGAVTGHTPVQIAVGCRLHGEARSALRIGALGDPTLCTAKDVVHAAGTTMWGAGLEMPPVCRATTRFARDAMACWSPERHWLFHADYRAAVHAVLLVRHRLELCMRAPEVASSSPVRLPHMPLELWLSVCAMLLRRHWMPGGEHSGGTI